MTLKISFTFIFFSFLFPCGNVFKGGGGGSLVTKAGAWRRIVVATATAVISACTLWVLYFLVA